MLFLAIVSLATSLQVGAQTPATALLDKKVSGFELRNETFFDGLAKVNAQTDLSIAIEFVLKDRISDRNITYPRLTARIQPGTVREALNQLCVLENQFTWSRYKNTINIYPASSSMLGEKYFMNRRLPRSIVAEISDPAEAIFRTVAVLPGPLEQIAFSQSGGAPGFSRPWSLSLDGLTVRQAFDEIAEHLGRGYGWTLGGAREFRVMRFHAKLLPEAKSLPDLKAH
jgi:hypothetical protein